MASIIFTRLRLWFRCEFYTIKVINFTQSIHLNVNAVRILHYDGTFHVNSPGGKFNSELSRIASPQPPVRQGDVDYTPAVGGPYCHGSKAYMALLMSRDLWTHNSKNDVQNWDAMQTIMIHDRVFLRKLCGLFMTRIHLNAIYMWNQLFEWLLMWQVFCPDCVGSPACTFNIFVWRPALCIQMQYR